MRAGQRLGCVLALVAIGLMGGVACQPQGGGGGGDGADLGGASGTRNVTGIPEAGSSVTVNRDTTSTAEPAGSALAELVNVFGGGPSTQEYQVGEGGVIESEFGGDWRFVVEDGCLQQNWEGDLDEYEDEFEDEEYESPCEGNATEWYTDEGTVCLREEMDILEANCTQEGNVWEQDFSVRMVYEALNTVGDIQEGDTVTVTGEYTETYTQTGD